MSIGMECSLYTPEICDGHYCPRDEDHCHYVDQCIAYQEKEEQDAPFH